MLCCCLLLVLLCVCALPRNIDYEEFCRMMLTDEHERRGSKQEARAARHTHSQRSHSRCVRCGPGQVHADMLSMPP
jgi:hypothetical protein